MTPALKRFREIKVKSDIITATTPVTQKIRTKRRKENDFDVFMSKGTQSALPKIKVPSSKQVGT